MFTTTGPMMPAVDQVSRRPRMAPTNCAEHIGEVGRHGGEAATMIDRMMPNPSTNSSFEPIAAKVGASA